MEHKRIYIDLTNSRQVGEGGAVITAFPTLSYYAVPVWDVILVDQDMNVFDLSEATTWTASVDTDFSSSTEPMVRTIAADIDASAAASGIIKVPLDTRTQNFLDKVDGKNSIGAFFELRGRDSESKVIYDARIRINCLGVIDPEAGEPLPVVSGGVTINDVYALLRAATEYQFSEDGVNWHSTQLSSDYFYQTRYPEGEWSETIELPSGTAIGITIDPALSPTSENPVQNKAVYAALSGKQDVITAESKLGWALVSGAPTIPAFTSDLFNDSGYVTSSYVDGAIGIAVSGKADASELSSKLDKPNGGTSGQFLMYDGTSGVWATVQGGGGAITPQDVVGLDSYVSGQVSAGWYTKAEIDAMGIHDYSGDISYLSGATDFVSGKVDDANDGISYISGKVDDANDGITFISGKVDEANDGITFISGAVDELSSKLSLTYHSSTVAVDFLSGDYQKIEITGNSGASTLTISNMTNGDALAIEFDKLSGTTVEYSSTEIVPSGAGHFLIGVIKVNDTMKITSATELTIW